ncbi:hypothetical protein TRFO_03637 [Tritrichomonas foetus]|uniref:Myb-like DNA-binding domain containing protein n=1 Tax=Tritrichomonas foetus TaxID=1144522 RepID=A0A1J4KSG7_9EUKA|nr:hypothetical protein TRFO_03637 [Tritrichomonas foetus]|eukprot:OHT12606.1 hypothetical protein TRFO_03637 [Tritrichomonas foetus]
MIDSLPSFMYFARVLDIVINSTSFYGLHHLIFYRIHFFFHSDDFVRINCIHLSNYTSHHCCWMQRTKRHPFTEYEDKTIRENVMTLGEDWDSIAKKLGGRTPKQCHDRYINYLREGLRNDPWTQQEDEVLIKLHKEIGPKWSKMMRSLQGRSGNDIKNRWHKHLIKRAGNSVCSNKNKALIKPQIIISPPVPQQSFKSSQSSPIIPQNQPMKLFCQPLIEPKIEPIRKSSTIQTGKIDLCASIGWTDCDFHEFLEELSGKEFIDPFFNESPNFYLDY